MKIAASLALLVSIASVYSIQAEECVALEKYKPMAFLDVYYVHYDEKSLLAERWTAPCYGFDCPIHAQVCFPTGVAYLSGYSTPSGVEYPSGTIQVACIGGLGILRCNSSYDESGGYCIYPSTCVVEMIRDADLGDGDAPVNFGETSPATYAGCAFLLLFACFVAFVTRVPSDWRTAEAAPKGNPLHPWMSCMACRNKPRAVVSMPCGHVTMCVECSKGLRENCAFCERPVQTNVLMLFP